MKTNWKIYIAIVVIVGVLVWSISSVMPHSFSGSHLTFSIGNGTVMVNNLSDAPVPVQLVGTGIRFFTVASKSEGLSGSSTTQGSGKTATQLLEYAAPPGIIEFTIGRGTNVNFVSNSDAQLQATVQPLSEGDFRTTLIVAAVVVLGGLFYISRSTGHSWIKTLRRQEILVPVVVAPAAETLVVDPNRGRDGRMYSNYGTKD